MTVVRGPDLDLTSSDIARAAAFFGIRATEPLGGYENLVLRSTEPEGQILRLTHTSRRTVEMIDAEFHYMDHMSQNGVGTVAPIRSKSGALAEVIETSGGDELIVASMTEAEGSIRRREEWSDADIETYGALLGGMHRATTTYEAGERIRPSWQSIYDDVHLDDSGGVDKDIHGRWTDLMEATRVEEAGQESWLLHLDAHIWNLHLTDDGLITVFDFDDASYGTPAHDLAIVLFHWMTGVETDPATEAERFLERFLRGYEREWSLTDGWQEGVDLFLSVREIVIYWLIARDEPDDLSPGEKRFMTNRRERIVNDVPFLGIPLAELV